MSAPLKSAKIPHGTVGTATLDSTADILGFKPGQTFFSSFYYKATRISGTNTAVITAKLRWWDASNVELTATTRTITIDASTSGFVFDETIHIVPAGAVRCRPSFSVVPGGGTFLHDIWLTVIRVGKSQAFADVTQWIDGPSQSTIFKLDYAGSPETGEFPRDLSFRLMTTGGQITSGLVWTYRLLSGSINGFTSADGVKSMSGVGTGILTVSSMASSSASVEITVTYGGQPFLKTVALVTQLAGAPISGGGGGGGGATTIVSKTSGFSGPSTTSFNDTSGAMTGTMPGGATTANVNINLDFTPSDAGTDATYTIELKLMRDISGTPTQVGSTQSEGSREDYFIDLPNYWIMTDAYFSLTIADTGLTAGTSYTWRIYARVVDTGSGTILHTITGTVTVTA
jgi:hypothetical protein